MIEQREMEVIALDFSFLQRCKCAHRTFDDRRAQRPAVEQFLQHAAVDGVVVHCEHADIIEYFFLARRQRGHRVVDRQAQPDTEIRSLVDDALCGDFTAHQLDDVLADRKPETSAAEFARMRAVGLFKFFKHARQFLGRNTDASVLD